MRGILASIAICVTVASAPALSVAHPGVGIVVDRRGNVYYTDLKQIWKIAPDGRQTIEVPGVHSHELFLDSTDNLYGEHLWYTPNQSPEWHRRIWKRGADGVSTDLLSSKDGFPTDSNLACGHDGTLAWIAATGSSHSLTQRLPTGDVTSTIRLDGLEAPGRMVMAGDGSLYMIDRGALKSFKDGALQTLSKALTGHEVPPARVRDRSYQMGLWLDRDDNVYVAVAEEALVLKVNPKGESAEFARCGEGWRPSGGVFDSAGVLWLLEYNSKNDVRVHRIKPCEPDRFFVPPADRA